MTVGGAQNTHTHSNAHNETETHTTGHISDRTKNISHQQCVDWRASFIITENITNNKPYKLSGNKNNL